MVQAHFRADGVTLGWRPRISASKLSDTFCIIGVIAFESCRLADERNAARGMSPFARNVGDRLPTAETAQHRRLPDDQEGVLCCGEVAQGLEHQHLEDRHATGRRMSVAAPAVFRETSAVLSGFPTPDWENRFPDFQLFRRMI